MFSSRRERPPPRRPSPAAALLEFTFHLLPVASNLTRDFRFAPGEQLDDEALGSASPAESVTVPKMSAVMSWRRHDNPRGKKRTVGNRQMYKTGLVPYSRLNPRFRRYSARNPMSRGCYQHVGDTMSSGKVAITWSLWLGVKLSLRRFR
jgi:hypothetical protein